MIITNYIDSSTDDVGRVAQIAAEAAKRAVRQYHAARGDKLAEYLATIARFDWAQFNCCHYAGGWLVANGQPDPMQGVRATRSLRSARRAVHARGGIVRAVSDLLGREPIAAALAQVGDIVHFQLEGAGFTLGICNGTQSICIDDQGGTSFMPTTQGTCAWRLKP